MTAIAPSVPAQAGTQPLRLFSWAPAFAGEQVLYG